MAHGEHPVIIDLETCPGYIIQTEESSVRRKTETLLAKSVLHTGILPVLTWGAGKEAVILSADKYKANCDSFPGSGSKKSRNVRNVYRLSAGRI